MEGIDRLYTLRDDLIEAHVKVKLLIYYMDILSAIDTNVDEDIAVKMNCV